MQPARDSMAVEQFGPYEVYERLGMGGMASVHRAKKRGPADFERTVALKRMLSHLTEDRGFVDSFVREAKVVSLLAHPNIAQTYDFGRINGVFYIAMELVSGYDVRKLLRHAHRTNQAIPLPVVMSIVGELCDALDYAHSFVDENGTAMHIVHRDISPSNMLVAHTGHLKVIDFGIAKANSRQLHTETGTVKGKLGYMAPETALGMPVGPVSDVFSMGVVAWELITAMPLFSARTDFETMRKLREEQVAPPSHFNSACPPMLDHLILAALQREPEQRLLSARAFRATLDSIAQQFSITTSARGVADWIRNIMPESESNRPASAAALARAATALPHEHQTAISRPSRPSHAPPNRESSLRRSQEQMQLASEIWGEDGEASRYDGPGDDFSMSTSHPGGAGPTAYTPIGLRVPSLAAAHVRPSTDPLAGVRHSSQPAFGSQSSGAMHPAAYAQPEPRNGGKTVVLALAGLAVLAGILGGVLYAKREPALVAQPSLRFIVEPEGAVVEVAGSAIGSGSRIETEIAPGVYAIAVRRDGYKPWTSSVTVEAGDKQTINVALEPVPVAAAPPHVDPPRQDPQPEPGSGEGSAASAETPVPPVATDPVVVKVAKTPTKSSGAHGKKTQRTKGGASQVGSSNDPAEIASKADPVVTKPDPVVTKPDPVVTKPVAVVTKPDPPIEAKPARTPVVGPNVVQKLSGEIPTLRSSSGSGDVTAKICIDEGGKVTSVKMIKGPTDVSSDLQRAMFSWRFKAYANRDGKLSPVCFPHSLRIVLKP